MPAEFHSKITERIVAFLREIGLVVTLGSVNSDAFLPGIEVVEGGLVLDESKLLHPGDLLHEAGHLAVTPAALRPMLSGQVDIPDANMDAIESAAMSWSYAACIHLGLDPTVVFHDHGYHGRSRDLLLNFELGVFPGLYELVLAGMTHPMSSCGSAESAIFPAMQKWLRD